MTKNNNSFSLALAQEYIHSNEQFPISFDDAWQWLDYSRKDVAKRAFLKCGFVENLEYQSFHQSVEREIGGSVREVIKLSIECLKTWAMMAKTQKGIEVRKYFLECEQIAKTKQITAPQTYLEALKALVVSEEQKQLLEVENALLEEQNQQLAEAVDELFDYSSIIRIAKFNNVSEKLFKWQTLKAMSIKMKVEIKRVPSPRFEWQNLYSHDVWRYCYPDFKLPETTTLVIQN